MNCEEIKMLLAGYADGELSPIEKDAVASHVEQCGRCRQTVLDQQRVHHVLEAYQPPAVSEDAWNDIARRLKTEMTGKSDPAVLKTRARVEGLDPTPASQLALRADELKASGRDVAPRLRMTTSISAGPTLAVLVARPRKGRPGYGWVAHAIGALAACLVIGLGLAAMWRDSGPPLEPGSLARQSDVVIMEVQLMDQSYGVALNTGDSDDVVTMWLVPKEG
jgi:anti-sigma factor RsiW